MSAREQIIERLGDLARATDARDWETIRSILAEDARGYGSDGPDQIIANMRAHLDGCGFTQHLLGNHRITLLDENTARAFSYGRIMHVGVGDKEGITLEVYGEYDDKFVRVDGGWRLSRRWFDVQHWVGDWSILRSADGAAALPEGPPAR